MLCLSKSSSPRIPQPLANCSEASQAGNLIFAAGQLASDWKDGVPKEARRHPNFPYYTSDIKLQTDYILKNMAKTFKAAGYVLGQCRQGAGLFDGPQSFRRVRRSVAQSLQVAAAAHHGRNDRAIGEGYFGRDRPDRGASQPEGLSDQVRGAQAARELFRGDSCRRSRFRCRAACQRLQDRCAGECQARPEFPLLRIGHPASDRLHPEESSS